MEFFDFHHHHPNRLFGIYNLPFGEDLPRSYFSAGIHPKSINHDVEEQFAWLSQIASNEKCVAIGECGLDGLLENDGPVQEEVFERQIAFANALGKPLIIHCVKRFPQLLHLRKKAEVPMVIHGFNKKKSIGDELIRQDFYFSFGKSILHHVHLHEFVKGFPSDRLFLESDTSGFELQELYAKVCEWKETDLETLQQQVKENLQLIQIHIK